MPPRVPAKRPSVSLICEGACNPMLDHLDKMLAESRPNFAGVTSTAQYLRAVRNMRYTSHAPIGDEHARCLTCRTKRQWGGNHGLVVHHV